MDSREHAARIEEALRKLAPKLPGIDPQDLVLILDSIFRPFGTGRIFLLRRRPDGGGYVF